MVEAAITTAAIIGGLVTFLGLPVAALCVAISARRYCALLHREAERLQSDIPDDLQTAIVTVASEVDVLKDRLTRAMRSEAGAKGGRVTKAPPQSQPVPVSPGGNGGGRLPSDPKAIRALVRAAGRARDGE